MSLYPTKTRVQLLRDVDAGQVLNVVDSEVIGERIVLDDEEAGELRTVTARVRELEREGWVEQDNTGVYWRLTQTGLAIAYPGGDQ